MASSDRSGECVAMGVRASLMLACELGDGAPAPDAVSDDVIVQLLVFLGRPQPLAELGLNAAAAAAGEPSHSSDPLSSCCCCSLDHSLYSDDGDKLATSRGKGNVGGRCCTCNGDDRQVLGGCLRLALCMAGGYIWGSVRTKNCRSARPGEREKMREEGPEQQQLAKVRLRSSGF
jgi:hypothetical protein